MESTSAVEEMAGDGTGWLAGGTRWFALAVNQPLRDVFLRPNFEATTRPANVLVSTSTLERVNNVGLASDGELVFRGRNRDLLGVKNHHGLGCTENGESGFKSTF